MFDETLVCLAAWGGGTKHLASRTEQTVALPFAKDDETSIFRMPIVPDRPWIKMKPRDLIPSPDESFVVFV